MSSTSREERKTSEPDAFSAEPGAATADGFESSSHINPNGDIHMVDVGGKSLSRRMAVARGEVLLPEDLGPRDGTARENRETAQDWRTPKGPVFQTAVLAGIQGAKQCSNLIPLCHPLPLDSCDVEIRWADSRKIIVESRVRCTGKTGVEMEALAAVSAACLTIYDMGKSITKGIEIANIRLIQKQGGKSDYVYNS